MDPNQSEDIFKPLVLPVLIGMSLYMTYDPHSVFTLDA